ncbi:hypothetical protein CEXT_485341 [Caerostris extrusa]|uniref:Uncharacterized protein n=1 Tax=Caerostris extrusa TaxID=172846 RepID=A0AAV4TM67_CAEEX|nr:hypothetical protein CEXT_485341 [Caerostris extrusa]
MSEDDVTYGLPSIRVRRDTSGSEGRLGGPFYTHIKTDSGGTFKWGQSTWSGRCFLETSNSMKNLVSKKQRFHQKTPNIFIIFIFFF